MYSGAAWVLLQPARLAEAHTRIAFDHRRHSTVWSARFKPTGDLVVLKGYNKLVLKPRQLVGVEREISLLSKLNSARQALQHCSQKFQKGRRVVNLHLSPHAGPCLHCYSLCFRLLGISTALCYIALRHSSRSLCLPCVLCIAFLSDGAAEAATLPQTPTRHHLSQHHPHMQCSCQRRLRVQAGRHRAAARLL